MTRPRVLAFDCSAAACSVAIATTDATGDVAVLARRAQTMQRGHAAALMPMIEASLAEAGLRPSDLDLIATTIGPGSFTGVRIALAAARGLALALDLPLAGLTTIETLLAGAMSLKIEGISGMLPRRVLAAIETHRGDYYAGFEDAPVPFIADTGLLATRAANASLLIVGDAATELCGALGRAGVDAMPGPSTTPDPEVLARLTLRRGIDYWRAANRRDGLPRPLYLQPAAVTAPKRSV